VEERSGMSAYEHEPLAHVLALEPPALGVVPELRRPLTAAHPPDLVEHGVVDAAIDRGVGLSLDLVAVVVVGVLHRGLAALGAGRADRVRPGRRLRGLPGIALEMVAVILADPALVGQVARAGGDAVWIIATAVLAVVAGLRLPVAILPSYQWLRHTKVLSLIIPYSILTACCDGESGDLNA